MRLRSRNTTNMSSVLIGTSRTAFLAVEEMHNLEIVVCMIVRNLTTNRRDKYIKTMFPLMMLRLIQRIVIDPTSIVMHSMFIRVIVRIEANHDTPFVSSELYTGLNVIFARSFPCTRISSVPRLMLILVAVNNNTPFLARHYCKYPISFARTSTTDHLFCFCVKLGEFRVQVRNHSTLLPACATNRCHIRVDNDETRKAQSVSSTFRTRTTSTTVFLNALARIVSKIDRIRKKHALMRIA